MCPICGSPDVPCSCEIASWVASEVSSAPPGPDHACTACGYSGEMERASCPACGAVQATGQPDPKLQMSQLVVCPECGRQIRITADEQGKTVVCPGCSYFLGTPSFKSKGVKGT